MTQSLKIECLVTDLALEGEIVSFLVTKEQLTAGLSKKADLVEGKIQESNLPDFIANSFQTINQKLVTLEESISDGIQSAKDYSEAYANEKLIVKADLVDGKVPQTQLPSVGQYEGLSEALNGVLDQARRDMIERTDEIQRTKVDLGEDGKVVRTQLPNYDKIPGLETVVTDLYDSKANVDDVETSFKESQDQLDAHSLLLQSLGSILPFNPSNTYSEGYVTLKDGSLQQLVSGNWIPFKINALNLVDLSGESQQQVNYNGGSKWHYRDGGYQENERAVLDNGVIVKSTDDGNVNDPNVNMTGWELPQARDVFDASGLSQQEINNGVESIADLLTIPSAKNGSRVYVKSYHAGLNKGGGTFIYNVSKSQINDGILCFNGWVRASFMFITSDMVGCHADGITNDRSYIQNAINILSPLKIPLYLSDGVHLVNGATQEQWSAASPFFVRSYIFDNRSNMSIIGNGVSTVIKYADGAALIDFGATLFSSNPSMKLYDLHWDGLVIDQNGYNNKLEHNRAFVQSNQAIVLAVGARASVKNCTFKDFTGMQVIYSRQHFDWDDNTTGVDEPFQDLVIEGNTFIDCGWLDGTNWSLQGYHDHSTLFLTGTYAVRNNTFIQNTVGMYAGTCCELHGKGFLSGNTIKKYSNAFLSVGMYRDADNTVTGNWVYDCTSLAYTDTHGITKAFNNRLTVIGNFFRQATFYIDESTVFGQNRTMFGITGYGRIGNVHIVIKGNVIETDGLYSNRTPENIVKYNSVIQTQFFNSIVFEGNTVKGSKGSLFRIGKVVNSTCKILSKNNSFEDCGSGDLLLMGNSIFYHDNEGALEYGVKMDEVKSVGNEFYDCSYKYIMTTTVEAEGLMFPSKLECNDKFYGFLPYTLDHSATMDALQTTSFMFDVSCYNPVGNRTVYNRPGDAWFSYNQWGKFTIFADKQKPSTYLKDGTMQDWLISV